MRDMDIATWLRDLYGLKDVATAEIDPRFLPEVDAANLFEAAVIAAQKAQQDLFLMPLFAGALVGTRRTSAGDVYCPRWVPKKKVPDVWLWHHDEAYEWSHAAPSFEVLEGMIEARARLDAGDEAGAVARWEDLGAAHATPRDYDFGRLKDVLARAKPKGKRPPAVPSPDGFARAGWIVARLLGESEPAPDPALLRAGVDALVDGNKKSGAADALYWLWCAWWLGDDDAAAELAARAAKGPRLVADAARLVRELLDGRRTIGTVDVAAVRAAHLAPPPDRYPPRVEIGRLAFARDDSLAARVVEEAWLPAVSLPPPASDQLRYGNVPLAHHPDGRRVLVAAARSRPPAPGQAGAYDHVLVEIDTETGALEVVAVLPGAPRRARYASADLVLAFCPKAGIVSAARLGGQVVVDVVPTGREEAVFVGDGRTVVAVGAGAAGVAHRDRAGWCVLGGTTLDVDRVGLVDGKAVVAHATNRVAYVVEGLAAAAAEVDPGDSVVFRRSFCPVAEIPVREGPPGLRKLLRHVDIARQLTTGRCLVLRFTGEGARFEVMAGDDGGLHALTPPLTGGNLYYTLLGGDRATICTDGAVHEVDVGARTSAKLCDLPSGIDVLYAAGDVLVGLAGGALRVFARGDEIRRVAFPVDATWVGPLLGGRALAIQSPSRGIVIVAMRGAEPTLLGATDPAVLGPANAALSTLDSPPGYGRIFAKQGDLRREALNLEAALSAGHAAPLGDALPEQPWTVRPIPVR